MISLPEHLPRNLAKQLSALAEKPQLSELLAGFSSLIREELGASEVVCSVSFDKESTQLSDKETVCWILENKKLNSSSSNSLSASWVESGLHERFLNLSTTELNARSYSVFSWPFPSATIETTSENSEDSAATDFQLELPKEFSLYLPFSSRFVCQSKCDLKFSGYCVAFFNKFPSSPENFAHLLIQLPIVLSDVLNAHQRDLRETYFFSGVLSHELKRGVLGLINRLDREEVSKSANEVALTNAKRLSKSLDSLFLLEKYFVKKFRASSMELSPERELEELLCDAIDLGDAYNKTLNVSKELSGKKILFDPSLFQHALVNIIENAFKYSSSSEVNLAFNEGKNELQISVEDGGPAILEENKDLIFTMGYRFEDNPEKQGRGLGLFLVKLILDYHDASIRVEETASGGNKFVIGIPYAK